MIKVEHPGFYTTVQDLGRFDGVAYGVPCSGAMDQEAYARANRILGNPVNAAALECTMQGPKLTFTVMTRFCISGAQMEPLLNDTPISQDTVVTARAGDRLRFSSLSDGIRTYIAIFGGIDTPVVMGSRSMYPGITEISRLTLGMELAVGVSETKISRTAGNRPSKRLSEIPVLDMYPGPEWSLLPDETRQLIGDTLFHISPNNNRMGYQLEETIPNALSQMITSLVLPGTIQLTPSGRLIILMRDAQTTGGYPRIGQLSDEAINILAQSATGQALQLRLVDYTGH